jgi:hypothetical protein
MVFPACQWATMNKSLQKKALEQLILVMLTLPKIALTTFLVTDLSTGCDITSAFYEVVSESLFQ